MPAERLAITVVAHDVGGIGGMQRVLGEMVGGLLLRGHRVTVVARSCELAPHERLRWVRVPGPARPFPLSYVWFFVVGSLLTWCNRGDITHTTGAIVFNRCDVCTVHLCHHAVVEQGDLRRVSRGGVLYRVNAAVAEWMSRAAERLAYRPRRCRVLSAVSRGLAHELERAFPTMNGRVRVIPNGVDVQRFTPPLKPKSEVRRALGLPVDGQLAVFVGSEWERKGLRVAIEALAEAPDWQLVVVGAGDRGAYTDWASARGVCGRIHFRHESTDITRYFQAADAFVFPTRYETFSLVSYEAAACGVPLLAGRTAGIEDILRDGVNGWFVNEDAARVAEHLRALQDPAIAGAMSRAARMSSLAFTWDRAVGGYEETFLQIHERRRTESDVASPALH